MNLSILNYCEIFNSDIVLADNCHIADSSGKKYVDFESGVWCTSLGHNNKQVNEALIRQLNTISHAGGRYTSKVVYEAAEKVLELLNFIDGKCTFLSSGSEAVEFGIRVAQAVMDKPCFLYLDNFYLSAYGISATRNEEEWIPLNLSEYKGDPLDFLKDIPFDKIGAFVFEPGNASGAVNLPPKELIKAIEDAMKATGGIIIVDEVTTGIGRTGKWFGFQHYDITPDIVSCGKGIGNGYPVSVVAMSKHISELIEKIGMRYAQSHQNDPLGCAALKEVISIIENEKMIQKAANMGDMLESELKSLLIKHKCVKEVRGVGLMYALEFFRDNQFPLKKIHRELFDSGYIAGVNPAANLLRFYPPLTIEEAHIKNMASALDKILLKHI